MFSTSYLPNRPGLTSGLHKELAHHAIRCHLPKGKRVFSPGRHLDSLLILMSGTLRIGRIAPGGQEITLCRIHSGQGCVLTTDCLTSEDEQLTTGVAETDLDILSVPRAAFDDLMIRSSEFRSLIFQAYSRRIADLLQMIEDATICRTGESPARIKPNHS